MLRGPIRRPCQARWRLGTLLLVPLFLLLATSLLPWLITTASAAPASSCAGPVTRQDIYDCAGLLTPTETAHLETLARAVGQAAASAAEVRLPGEAAQLEDSSRSYAVDSGLSRGRVRPFARLESGQGQFLSAALWLRRRNLARSCMGPVAWHQEKNEHIKDEPCE